MIEDKVKTAVATKTAARTRHGGGSNAAAVKAKVTLIEKHRMGGDCLNTCCVPSRALIRSARLLSNIRRSGEFGVRSASADFDFADVMERVQRVIRTIEPHDSVERFTKLGVECLQGNATITSPWTVEVETAGGDQRLLTTRNIVIAAGATPFIPSIPGLRELNPLTSETIWNLRTLPKRPVVLGGGPIGSELAQCRALRFESDAGRDASAHPHPRRSRSLRNGGEPLSRRRHGRSGGAQGERGARGKR